MCVGVWGLCTWAQWDTALTYVHTECVTQIYWKGEMLLLHKRVFLQVFFSWQQEQDQSMIPINIIAIKHLTWAGCFQPYHHHPPAETFCYFATEKDLQFEYKPVKKSTPGKGLMLTVLKYEMQNLYCFLASRILQQGKYEITSCGWEGRRKEKLFLSDVISWKANWWWNDWIKDNRTSICGFYFFPPTTLLSSFHSG